MPKNPKPRSAIEDFKQKIQDEHQQYVVPNINAKEKIINLSTYGNAAGAISTLSLLGALIGSGGIASLQPNIFWTFLTFLLGLACKISYAICDYARTQILLFQVRNMVTEDKTETALSLIYWAENTFVIFAFLSVGTGSLLGIAIFYSLTHN